MYRSFMSLSQVVLEGKSKNLPPSSSTTKILLLPAEILNTIFDKLDVLDRCSFALCCKPLLLLAQRNEHLDYLILQPPREDRLEHFFRRQLAHGWIPDDLEYCPDCGKFVSRLEFQWRATSEKYSREHSGRISRIWRARREDGWLRYWIERWCTAGAPPQSPSLQALIQKDPTTLVCPRCAMSNPDCNWWRESMSSKPAKNP